jgi:hypothetical protein
MIFKAKEGIELKKKNHKNLWLTRLIKLKYCFKIFLKKIKQLYFFKKIKIKFNLHRVD